MPTSPTPYVVDKKFSSKRDLRGHFNQRGSVPTGEMRPNMQRLKLYEQLVYQDTILYTALGTLVKGILATVGSISHPDPEIAEFLNYNVNKLQDKINAQWQEILHQLLFTTLWSGFSTSEVLFDLEFGTLFLDGVVTYHPNTIVIKPDRNGMMTENKPTAGGMNNTLSGIYQSPSRFKPEKQLPFWKIIYVANNTSFGNYYGRSIVAPCYKWSRLKDALVDMMAVALDRFGNPLLYVKMPVYPTERITVDSSTGQERQMTTQEVFQEALQNLDSNGNVLFLPQQDGTNKPEVGALTTGNNVGTAFLDAIRYVAEQEVLPIGVPPFLLTNELSGSDGNTERRMEVYYSTLEHYRKIFLGPIAQQCFSRLIEHNFNRASAKYPAYFTRVYSDRPEDRVAVMQMVRGMTELGYFNPMEPQDFDMVRQMVRASGRPLSDLDITFIKELFVKKQSTNGGAGGRPTGSVSPLQTARPKVDKKPTGSVNASAA